MQWATPAVALGPPGASGLAHLGLPAWDKTGEPPIPSLARGSPAESGRPVASGRGRRCQGANPGGEGPDLVHRQRRGSPWQDHGSEAGRRWGTGDDRA
jgi:hypothetical protein